MARGLLDLPWMADGPKPRGPLQRAAGFLGEAFHRCARDSIDSQSAALAFYTLFALGPVLLVVTSIAGRLFGQARVHDEVLRQLQSLMGPDAGRGVTTAVERAAGLEVGGSVGALVAFIAFVIGATAVFLQLHEALNRIWGVAPRPGPLIWSLLRNRVVSLAIVLAVGCVLVVSLTLSVGLLALADAVRAQTTLPVAAVVVANEALAFAVFTVLVALIYRTLPDANLAWRDVFTGAVVTSVLFSVGKWLIGFYLARTAVASRFGVAGSLAVILLWVYYASTIVLFGAELTAVHSSRRPHTRAQGGDADRAASRKVT